MNINKGICFLALYHKALSFYLYCCFNTYYKTYIFLIKQGNLSFSKKFTPNRYFETLKKRNNRFFSIIRPSKESIIKGKLLHEPKA
jgi:hypothetical protein